MQRPKAAGGGGPSASKGGGKGYDQGSGKGNGKKSDTGGGKGGYKSGGKGKGGGLVERKDMPAGCENVRPAPGPGESVTWTDLRARWQTMGKSWVLGFYGHRSGQYACLSNFYERSFEFEMPQELCSFPLTDEERTFTVPFSEVALMACKAAAMGDKASFDTITTSTGASQATVKSWGRQVQPFCEKLWQEIVCSIAYEIVYQKFAKAPELRRMLLSTEERVIAEAAPNDPNWGIGFDETDSRLHNPREWQGTNMLGWALMETRASLRNNSQSGCQDPMTGASKPAASTAPQGAYSSTSPGGALTEEEKEFMKLAKKVREILKLEATESSGKQLDPKQTDKILTKSTVFAEFNARASSLPSSSDCLLKAKDLLESDDVLSYQREADVK